MKDKWWDNVDFRITVRKFKPLQEIWTLLKGEIVNIARNNGRRVLHCSNLRPWAWMMVTASGWGLGRWPCSPSSKALHPSTHALMMTIIRNTSNLNMAQLQQCRNSLDYSLYTLYSCKNFVNNPQQGPMISPLITAKLHFADPHIRYIR